MSQKVLTGQVGAVQAGRLAERPTLVLASDHVHDLVSKRQMSLKIWPPSLFIPGSQPPMSQMWSPTQTACAAILACITAADSS